MFLHKKLQIFKRKKFSGIFKVFECRIHLKTETCFEQFAPSGDGTGTVVVRRLFFEIKDNTKEVSYDDLDAVQSLIWQTKKKKIHILKRRLSFVKYNDRKRVVLICF